MLVIRIEVVVAFPSVLACTLPATPGGADGSGDHLLRPFPSTLCLSLDKQTIARPSCPPPLLVLLSYPAKVYTHIYIYISRFTNQSSPLYRKNLPLHLTKEQSGLLTGESNHTGLRCFNKNQCMQQPPPAQAQYHKLQPIPWSSLP